MLVEKLELGEETRGNSWEAANHVSAETPFDWFPFFCVRFFGVRHSKGPNARPFEESFN
jgi:hypothetical protein